jgi:uncharacterized protein (TIGR03435 family)
MLSAFDARRPDNGVQTIMMRLSALPALVVFTMSASAQPAPERLAFEVASVKPNNSPDGRNFQARFLPGGKILFKNAPLVLIVAIAYDLPFQSPRLTGGKEWKALVLEKYDIEATAGKEPDGLSAKAREARLKLMLQSLLEERFKMQVRKDPKDQPVYTLVIAKGGPKLQKSKTEEKDCEDVANGPQPGCHNINGGQGRGIHGDAITIADVALFVQNWTDRPVIDKTGLTDLYNIQTNGWVPIRPRPPGGNEAEAALAADPDRQSLWDIFQQLGLRMESQRGVVDMFYVEKVERPTGN